MSITVRKLVKPNNLLVVDDANFYSMKKVFQDVLKMPYYKNYAAESGAVHNMNNHEDAVKNVLFNHGFKQYTPPSSLHKKDEGDPSFLSNMGNAHFVEQPFGTHEAPDFIVKTANSNLIFIECKSSKGYTPLYNSGGVKPNYVYIFTSEKTNSTTIYKGSSIITDEQYRIIQEHIQKQREMDKITNQLLSEADVNHRGICYYTRPMINQCGGAAYTNYMKHQNRTLCEQEALEYVDRL